MFMMARAGAGAGMCCAAAPGAGVPAGCGRVSTQVQRVDGRDWWGRRVQLTDVVRVEKDRENVHLGFRPTSAFARATADAAVGRAQMSLRCSSFSFWTRATSRERRL